MRFRDDSMARFVRHSERGLGKAATLAEAQGVVFRCPCGGGHVLLVWFADKGVPIHAEPAPRWQVQGTGLNDLSLTPSICASCWHGWVSGGRTVELQPPEGHLDVGDARRLGDDHLRDA